MPIAYIFWGIMIFLFLFGGWYFWSTPASRPYAPHHFVILVLLAILGWQVFGAAVK